MRTLRLMRITLAANGLPSWPGDDVEFVCGKLAAWPKDRLAPKITELVTFMGLEHTVADDTVTDLRRTPAYMRVRAALHKALKGQRVERLGVRWRLRPKTPGQQSVMRAVADEARSRR